MRVVAILAAVVALASCGAPYALPDRGDAEVKAREAELAVVLAAAHGGGDCDVRLLGESAGSSFVWAKCLGPGGGVSAPMRVEGSDVQTPGDGTRYATDVRRLFPAGIAGAILSDPDRLRP